jgi:hypothetical protein
MLCSDGSEASYTFFPFSVPLMTGPVTGSRSDYIIKFGVFLNVIHDRSAFHLNLAPLPVLWLLDAECFWSPICIIRISAI